MRVIARAICVAVGITSAAPTFAADYVATHKIPDSPRVARHAPYVLDSTPGARL